MTTGVAVRPATAADEPFLARLLAQAKALEFAHFPPALAPQLIAQQREAQRRALAASGGEQLVIDPQGTPLGRIVVQERAGAVHLVDLTIDADHRGAGIGRELVDLVVASAGASGRDVTLQVDPGNAIARRLYANAGFVAETGDPAAIQMRRAQRTTQGCAAARR